MSDTAPEPPKLGELWAPELRPSNPGAFPFTQVELATACSASPASAARIQIITNHEEFERAFCRTARLDWNRFRLVVASVAERAVDVDVVSNLDRVTLVVQTLPDCDAAFASSIALVIPADSKPVLVLERPGPERDCPNGYGY